VRSKTKHRNWPRNSRKRSHEHDQHVIPSEVEGSRCGTDRFRYGIESLASSTASAALHLRLRFASLRMTARYKPL
jgi:hypothetical protein